MERPRWKANANLSPRRRAASWVATSCLWLALSVVLPWTTGEGVQAAFPPPVFESSVFNPFGLSNAGPYSIPRFVDIDGDGDLDAFVGVALGDEFFLANTGSATSPAFASPVADPFGLASIGGFAAPAFADIDGDGDFDLFVGKGLGGIEFFANTGTAVSPAFASPSPNPFGLSGTFRYTVPAFVDIDGDGDLDALVSESGGTTSFFRNRSHDRDFVFGDRFESSDLSAWSTSYTGL